jgi:hypothetical protein
MSSRIGNLGITLSVALGLALLTGPGCMRVPAPPAGESPEGVTYSALYEVDLDVVSATSSAGVDREAALQLPTDGVPRVYELTPDAEHWFVLDEDAVYVGIQHSGVVDPDVYVVDEQGERFQMLNLSGDGLFESPASNGIAVEPLGEYATPGAGWLVIIPQTYQNMPARIAIVASSEF